MIKNYLWASVFSLGFALLETALFSNMTFLPVLPDLLLLAVLFIAFFNGSLLGQCAGFTAGLILDFMSASPLGLNAMVLTIIAYAAGCFKDVLSPSRIFIPLLFGFFGTLAKAVLFFILSLLYGTAILSYNFLSPVFWMELGVNTLLAPIIFLFLSLFGSMLILSPEVQNYQYGK